MESFYVYLLICIYDQYNDTITHEETARHQLSYNKPNISGLLDMKSVSKFSVNIFPNMHHMLFFIVDILI